MKPSGVNNLQNHDALKFKLYCGNESKQDLKPGSTVGYSLLIDGNDYYLLKLFLFEKYFFLVKNRNSNNNYTVFSTKGSENGTFRNPVGWAELPSNNSANIEIFIPILGSPIRMNLFPV
ncbi:MAG: hypothetical protein JNL11_02095 [Bdellovibrionaceae bacterium]|nr:hypothetical protein [Pseudobdellovibrionaceae bacterium]